MVKPATQRQSIPWICHCQCDAVKMCPSQGMPRMNVAYTLDEDHTIDWNHGTEKSQPSIDFDKTGSCPSAELEATTVCWWWLFTSTWYRYCMAQLWPPATEGSTGRGRLSAIVDTRHNTDMEAHLQFRCDSYSQCQPWQISPSPETAGCKLHYNLSQEKEAETICRQ